MRGVAGLCKHIYVSPQMQRQPGSGYDTQLGYVYLCHSCFIYSNPGSSNLASVFCCVKPGSTVSVRMRSGLRETVYYFDGARGSSLSISSFPFVSPHAEETG